MKKVFVCFILIVVLITHSTSYGQVYSDESLYANGLKNYNNSNWQYASIYLFALIQKNPQAFVGDPSFKKEVITAFDYVMAKLHEQVSNSQSYVAEQTRQQTKNGIGVSQSGLEYKPALRAASKVKL